MGRGLPACNALPLWHQCRCAVSVLCLRNRYKSSGGFFTQMEARGFSRMTFWPDRPDVLYVPALVPALMLAMLAPPLLSLSTAACSGRRSRPRCEVTGRAAPCCCQTATSWHRAQTPTTRAGTGRGRRLCWRVRDGSTQVAPIVVDAVAVATGFTTRTRSRATCLRWWLRSWTTSAARSRQRLGAS